MENTVYVDAIEAELRRQVARLQQSPTAPFHEMLAYHLGWTGEGAGPAAGGKRVRPLMLMLSCASCSDKWLRAAPAAAAVELIHNFSLVHDDIQDRSERRRGRLTVWAKWGEAMAINVGDALFALANRSMLDLQRSHPAAVVVQSSEILANSCDDLTRGQYLDMAYEGRADLSLDDYWTMIRGKTASLLAASCQLGALLGEADDNRREAFRAFGEHLGLAFQVQDDVLGIWGDEIVTGKSVSNDLTGGKNSLPVVWGLAKSADFARLWKKGPLQPDDAPGAKRLLEEAGALEFAREQARRLTGLAMGHLEAAGPQGGPGTALLELANALLKREQ